MFVRIDNDPRDYAWGSTHAIAELRGRTPQGGPEAELWLGAHPGSPARILDTTLTDGAQSLDTWKESAALPFLLKILAADKPLSLQAHPSLAQAQAGFERENRAGIPLNAPDRNYADANHKPEMIFALSEPFDALSGFRAPTESAAALRALGGGNHPVIDAFADTLSGEPATSLRAATEWILAGGPDVGRLVDALIECAADHQTGPGTVEADTVRLLSDAFPGDPGVVLALLLNRVRLSPGQVLYLPAGNIHAYMNGLGIELMAASDNVLRGGLTPKRIDVQELVAIVDFSPRPATPLTPEHPEPGVTVFRPALPDFLLAHVVGSGDGNHSVNLTGTTIALCTAGSLQLVGTDSSLELKRGEAALITIAEENLRITGTGELFLAMPGQ